VRVRIAVLCTLLLLATGAWVKSSDGPRAKPKDKKPAAKVDAPMPVAPAKPAPVSKPADVAKSQSPSKMERSAPDEAPPPGVVKPHLASGRRGSSAEPYCPPSDGRRGRGRHDESGWHGRRDRWRHEHYRGSWHFLWHCGPIVFPVPVYEPHVIRVPRHRAGVYIRQTGGDYVGSRFTAALGVELRHKGLRQVWSGDDATLELYIVSMDEDPEEPGYGSAVSVSYIWRPGHRFITAQLLDVGDEQVEDLAETVADYADDLIGRYR
jgi:hypothetical protein